MSEGTSVGKRMRVKRCTVATRSSSSSDGMVCTKKADRTPTSATECHGGGAAVRTGSVEISGADGIAAALDEEDCFGAMPVPATIQCLAWSS